MKSKYFSDPAQVLDVFVETFRRAGLDPQIAGIVGQLNQLVCYDYSQDDPGIVFYMDSRGGKMEVEPGPPPDKADVTILSGVDTGHLAWSNQLNPTIAMATGKIKAKGSAMALLKLAPVLKLMAPIYKQVLAEKGLATS